MRRVRRGHFRHRQTGRTRNPNTRRRARCARRVSFYFVLERGYYMAELLVGGAGFAPLQLRG